MNAARPRRLAGPTCRWRWIGTTGNRAAGVAGRHRLVGPDRVRGVGRGNGGGGVDGCDGCGRKDAAAVACVCVCARGRARALSSSRRRGGAVPIPPDVTDRRPDKRKIRKYGSAGVRGGKRKKKNRVTRFAPPCSVRRSLRAHRFADDE
uniref:Uncharacterized protein n=1 Tax=Sipha flava TaxID=143950 RepID=A0A2S2Q6C6_9HEMI